MRRTMHEVRGGGPTGATRQVAPPHHGARGGTTRAIAVAGFLGALAACATRRPHDGLVDFMALLPSPGDSAAVTQRRDSLQRVATAAGVRIASIEVTPRHLEVVAGDELRVRDVVRIVGRDSTGTIVRGWAPYFLLSDGGMARLHESGLVAVLPGRLELFVHVSPFRTMAGQSLAVPNRVSTSLFVTVRERPYARPRRVPSDARGVLDGYIAALEAGQWADAVRYVDLARFGAFVNSHIASYRPPAPRPELTLEQYIASFSRQPNPPPRAVLEYQFAQRQRAVRAQRDPRELATQFVGVTSVEQLGDLPVAEAATRWLEATDPRAVAQAAARRMECDSMSTRLLVGTATQHLRAVGVVVVDDSVAWGYVAPRVRSPFLGTANAPTPVLLRSRGGPWRVDPQPAERQVPGVSSSCPGMRRP